MKWYRNYADLVNGYYEEKSKDGKAGNMYFEGDVLYSYGEHFPLAVRTAYDQYIINGDKYSSSTTNHQGIVFSAIPNDKRVEVPFSALGNVTGELRRRIDLDEVREVRIIDYWKDEYIDTGRLNKYGYPIMEHKLGAALLDYKGRKLVSSIDPSGSGGGLYFLTELIDNEVDNLDDAFVSMMPEEVPVYCDYKRQGEWFFVPVDDLLDTVISHASKDYYLKHSDKERESRHYATLGMEVQGRQFVQGVVKHSQGQHRQLKLYETGVKPKDRIWYEAFESPQKQSWGSVGNVD